jgi:hypothetical protein
MDLENKIAILAEIWHDRDAEELEEFVKYNNIGLLLAYADHAGLVEINHDGIAYIEETYDLLAESFELDPDEDFYNLAQMAERSEI